MMKYQCGGRGFTKVQLRAYKYACECEKMNLGRSVSRAADIAIRNLHHFTNALKMIKQDRQLVFAAAYAGLVRQLPMMMNNSGGGLFTRPGFGIAVAIRSC
jgi:hypothetical protein